MNPAQSTAVQQALQRRGMGTPTPQLAQASPQAQMQSPTPQPANPSDMNKASAPQQAGSPKFQPQNQQDFIVSSLIEQLKNSQKLDHEKYQLASGIVPKSMQTPPTSPGPSAPQMPQGNSGSNPFAPPTSMPTSQMQGGNRLASRF